MSSSTVSESLICSRRILLENANSVMMASAAVKLSSPAGAPPPAVVLALALADAFAGADSAAPAASVAVFAVAAAFVAGAPAALSGPASDIGAGFSVGRAASAPTSGFWLAWSAAAELLAVSSSSTSAGASVTSASMTTSWSRSTLYTGKLTPATAMERCARLVNVGELARPTSMICSTRPNRSSWVSIQRTGEANCQDNSSTSSRRASFCGSMFAASMLSRRPDGARAAVASTKSWVSANGLATRFGT